MTVGNLESWMIRGARTVLGLDQRGLAELAGIGLNTLQRIEAMDMLDVRDDPDRRRDGGVSAEIVDKLLTALKREGVEIRLAGNGWPDAIVKIPKP